MSEKNLAKQDDLYRYKQKIIVLKSLNMKKGKFGSQVAHGAMGALLMNHYRLPNGDWVIPNTPAVDAWLSGAFTKVTLYVDTLEEMEQLMEEAKKRNLLHAKIVDNGRTVFNGVPTTTVLAIGPASVEDLDFTNHLQTVKD